MASLIFDLIRNNAQRWNLSDRKDQRKNMWLIRKKRPKLVIEYDKCTLFCTVLCHEQIRRRAWLLHDLSDSALQLSLPCMILLECGKDVFHALSNSRDRRDGEQASFLTDSPHIARKVEGADRRENLDSEICEGLRQQVGDAGYASSTMHIASETQVKPFDLTPQILKKGSRIVQELNSIREGKYWDDAKGGWLDPVLVRKARGEETQYVKKHAVYEKVPMSQCGKETGNNPSRLAGRTRTRERPSVRT